MNPDTTKTINVTQQDIDKGAPCDSESCPIALAVLRATESDGGAFGPEVAVGPLRVEIGALGEFRLPPVATKFRRRFDAGERVEPFSFEIELL